MTLPPVLRAQVDGALAERGAGPVTAVAPVGGGCVSPVARLEDVAGGRWFLKWTAPDHPPGLLAAEAAGLRTLAATWTVRVPAIVAADPGGWWLLLEWLEPGTADDDAWRRLGRDLAALHRRRGDRFGAPADNFIGPLPQANAPTSGWAEFWATRRIEPRLRQAVDGGWLDAADLRRFDTLLAALPERLAAADDEGPSTLHGDLWSGNVHVTASGPPAVIDPSVYHGHREVDLAMAELFGGFGHGFRSAYEETWPLAPGYAPVRRGVYQLYYLLVHVNLFGGAYVAGCRRALQDAGV